MAMMSDDKCLVCAQDCHMVVCELCEEASYCGDECEAADFMSHRQSCKFKERMLETQSICAVCDKAFSETDIPPVVCKDCFGIKYCSEECKRGNEAEHKYLLCNGYANLPLRPTIDHRLHIFFPAIEIHPRFMWIKPTNPSRHAVIDPEGAALHIESSGGSRHADLKSYNPTLFHVAAYLNSKGLQPNCSLGTATGLPPLRSMKGNALFCMRDPFGDVTDVSPGNLPRLVASFKQKEIKHERTHNKNSCFPQSAVPY